MNATELLKMQERLDTLKANRERNKGALEQNLKQLKTVFDVSSVEEANKLVKTLMKELQVKTEELGIISQKVGKQLDDLEGVSE